MDSPELLRAASLQLAFNPAEIEIVSVQEGDYFSRAGKGAFSNTIDGPGGRVSIGASSVDGAGVKGKARVLTLTVKPLTAAMAGTEITVIAATPVGATRSISRPGLPIAHRLTVGP